jgi:hypothetical protein
MARLAIAQQVIVPQIDRQSLIDSYLNESPHAQNLPRLCEIQNNHAIFKTEMIYQYNPKTKLRINLVCRVPFTDEMFQTDRVIEFLTKRKAVPFLEFSFYSYINNRGEGIYEPIL